MNTKAFFIGVGIGGVIVLCASGLWFISILLIPFFMDWSGDGDGREIPTSWDHYR